MKLTFDRVRIARSDRSVEEINALQGLSKALQNAVQVVSDPALQKSLSQTLASIQNAGVETTQGVLPQAKPVNRPEGVKTVQPQVKPMGLPGGVKAVQPVLPQAKPVVI